MYAQGIRIQERQLFPLLLLLLPLLLLLLPLLFLLLLPLLLLRGRSKMSKRSGRRAWWCRGQMMSVGQGVRLVRGRG
jgi:hypothetical protein